jgi:hypothetical protein
MPNSITYLNWIRVFEWYRVRCESKNGYKKDMYSKEIGLRAQNIYDNHYKFHSQPNWRGLYDYLMSARMFTMIMIMNKIFT